MKAKIWEEAVQIPTYGVGEPDKNPMFLEKRVYQGSSGKVYPHPVIEKIEDEKKLQTYKVIFLENEYIRVEIMPELGGRISRAYDKTNNYDFVYYNQVIKPALVGLAGPWISGGIEFNWPQHHRPNTFGPVEYRLEENADGSVTAWVGEVDRMYGTKVTCGFTLHPDKAYIEINAQLYNRTDEPQTFLWWANPAVAVNDYTQSVFPPDVHAVFDHGKRDVSSFPIATGTYYKMDYSEGVDISRYKNIPVPTSYMAYKSDFNFVGGYDHSKQAGLLHVANHHISPGKKQWTWGNGEFGQAWDRSLTDEDGPYIELMTGVYTDNQPDFTWLQPYEEKSFTQYFMPYKNVSFVKNASIDAAVNLQLENGKALVEAYGTSQFENAVIQLYGQDRIYFSETVTLSPVATFSKQVEVTGGEEEHELYVRIADANGRVLIDYKPLKPEIERIPDPAEALPEPEKLQTIEQLYLAGLHLEQYRHATFEPENYYLEGLKRDPSDIRINVAYGKLLVRRGLFAEAEKYFRTAVKSLTWKNPNPYDSEAYYQLGVALKYQGRLEAAFAAFYKAVWSAAWQDTGYFSLAQIATEQGNLKDALELVERSLTRNSRNYKARTLLTALYRRLGKLEAAANEINITKKLDRLEFGAHFEEYLLLQAQGDTASADVALQALFALMRRAPHNYIALAGDYADSGLHLEATILLEAYRQELGDQSIYPMVYYSLAYLYGKLGQQEKAVELIKLGEQASPDYCFPNSSFELLVLENVLEVSPNAAKAAYYAGNWYYDKKRHSDAIAAWEQSAGLDDSYATVFRNLALAYYNKLGQPDKAKVALEKAFANNNSDARVLYELDQLYKKLQVAPQTRLDFLNGYKSLVEQRDDLYIEFVTLHNMLKQHGEALALLQARKFHPWEGGEGKTLGQYTCALVELGRELLQAGQYAEAEQRFRAALENPENLSEAKLAGAQENNIYYYLGISLAEQGKEEEAQQAFAKASVGLEEPTSAMFYNDQPPEMIYYQGLAWLKLGNEVEAKRRFNKLIAYAEKHLFDDVKIDYFAVSLPDFLVFEENLNNRNVIHCKFMRALGLLGLGNAEEGKAQLAEVLELDCNHLGAMLHQ